MINPEQAKRLIVEINTTHATFMEAIAVQIRNNSITPEQAADALEEAARNARSAQG